jgi:hypothetical protein
MSTLNTGVKTLLDYAKELDPNGQVATVVELLMQTNEMLQDMPFVEGNLPTGNRTTIRTGLPAVFWRMFNQGVPTSKSTKAQVDEQCGLLEAWSEVDADLAKLGGNQAASRLSEARAFLEAMNQEMASTMFYGHGGLTPQEFTGLSPRYSLSTAPNGSNVLKAGGVGGDNASIWLVAWGEETIVGMFPKGTKAGLTHDDYGEQTLQVTNGVGGTRMRALQERWQWNCGLIVKDWRYAVRICNIDISDLNAANVKTLIDNMEHAAEILPNRLGRPVFYMNRTLRRFLRREARESVGAGGGLTFENFEGKRILMFGDIPIRTVDALLNTETLVA